MGNQINWNAENAHTWKTVSSFIPCITVRRKQNAILNTEINVSWTLQPAQLVTMAYYLQRVKSLPHLVMNSQISEKLTCLPPDSHKWVHVPGEEKC